MQKTKLLVYFLLPALLIVACGRYDRIDDGGFTKVTFRRSTTDTDANGIKAALNGSLLIYAHSNSFATNLKLNDENAPGQISLPNGSYTFVALGYENGPADLTGPTRCAKAGSPTRIELNGTPVSVALNLTAANCNDGIFFSSTNYYDTANTNFGTFEVVHCGTSVAATAFSNFTGTDTCISFAWTVAQRFIVSAPIYKSINGNYTNMGNAILSNCTIAATYGMPVTSNIVYPVGSTTAGSVDLFALEIETFSDTACTTSIARHKFPRGLIYGAVGPLGKVDYSNSAGAHARLFLREP